MRRIHIVLVGLGPHSKRIYISILRKFSITPSLIVDCKSQQNAVKEFLTEQNIRTQTYFVPDEEKNLECLSPQVSTDLDSLMQALGITHAIISTEPKAHFAYLQYFITRHISALTDKPITCPIDVCNSEAQALLIRKQFNYLLDLIDRYQTRVIVQCQRRYDRRYQWIKSVIKDLMHKYELPIHNIQVYHSDGSFYMPNEMLNRENHPYKYGYGKLLHSGYHFLDLLTFMLCWEQLPEHKRPTAFELTSMHYSPSDQMFSMDSNFLQKVFPKSSYASEFGFFKNGGYHALGEIDFVANLQFLRHNHVLTNCTLNLLHSGFSRRAWPKQALDTYKNNGRVRHEALCINMGPLLSIHIHSYQGCEIKDRYNPAYNHDDVGGLEHYEIYVFRNSEIIGGKPWEVIQGKDLFAEEFAIDKGFMGYNESARAQCVLDFLTGSEDASKLSEHHLTIELLTGAYQTIAKKRNGEIPLVRCNIEALMQDSLQNQSPNSIFSEESCAIDKT